RRRHTRFSRDWSSDVCSSDLLLFEPVDGGERLFRLVVFPVDIGLVDQRLLRVRAKGITRLDGFQTAAGRAPVAGGHGFPRVPVKIGRASCREREESWAVATEC